VDTTGDFATGAALAAGHSRLGAIQGLGQGYSQGRFADLGQPG
jgi:hypothetical protein